MAERAIFLDRDGTLVHVRHYPTRPEQLVLYDNLGQGLRTLQQAGFKLFVITNQGGIALGFFGEPELALMHAHLAHELAQLHVRINGFYHCPHHPDGVRAELAIACECRKPRPGMLLRAAAEHGIDLARSWFVGDILDDVEAGRRAGCRTVLVDLGTESPPLSLIRTPHAVARDTVHALAIIAAAEQIGPDGERYLPPSWQRELEVAR
ncbi:MAG: HAD family hydrolase [Roseiflexaceae bacterium]|nr:HAD family hydrolase [Roseiflexaceae bacterium]